jgi:competence protein ComEA
MFSRKNNLGINQFIMKTQQKISEYLRFSRKDRIAVLIIASILLTVFLLPSFLDQKIRLSTTTADTAWISALKQLEKPVKEAIPYHRNERNAEGEDKSDWTQDRYNNVSQAQLFSFDPNTLDDAGWERLGLRAKTIGTIRKYLEKGGRFKEAGDLRKIYGLRADQAERLLPYVKISSSRSAAASYPAEKTGAPEPSGRSRRAEPVDINTADSLTFKTLPGIGPVLAARIIRFREKLGGFHHITQIREVFGLQDSTFDKIEPLLLVHNTQVKQININMAGIDELRNHPYLRYDLAKLIISYRQQHGEYTTIEELKKIALIDQSVFEKIRHYITVQP